MPAGYISNLKEKPAKVSIGPVTISAEMMRLMQRFQRKDQKWRCLPRVRSKLATLGFGMERFQRKD